MLYCVSSIFCALFHNLELIDMKDYGSAVVYPEEPAGHRGVSIPIRLPILARMLPWLEKLRAPNTGSWSSRLSVNSRRQFM